MCEYVIRVLNKVVRNASLRLYLSKDLKEAGGLEILIFDGREF